MTFTCDEFGELCKSSHSITRSELGRPPLEMLQLLMRVFWWSSEISIEASSVSKMPWKFLRKHRMPLNQVVQLLPLITCSFCRSWLGFTTNRSGLWRGMTFLFDDDILEMLGTCPRCLHNVDSYCMDSFVFQQILPWMTGESQLCAEEIFQCASRIWGLDVPNCWPVAETVSKLVQLFVTFQ